MISLWVHVIWVLVLLTLHGVTAHLAQRRIRELEGALVAKKVLSGVDDCYGIGVANLTANDTLLFRTRYGQPLIEISSTATTQIDYKVLV